MRKMKRVAEQFDQYFPSSKRTKYAVSQQEEATGPLGLKLRKTPSLIDLIQVNLSMQSIQQPQLSKKEEHQTQTSNTSLDKRKATNFSAASLKIGAWEYISRYECDLVVKCYYAKKKLVWEVLEGGLKSKIEIQWSDISGLRASFPEDQPSMLEMELSRPPMFFKESNPQPRKHTIWQATSDFTGGQATTFKRHVLQFPNGIFDKHYEGLLQSDERLNKLSQKPLCDTTPYFYSSLGGAGYHHLQQQESYLSILKATMPALFQSHVNKENNQSVQCLRETPEEEQYRTYNGSFMNNMVEMRRPATSASGSTGMSEGVSGSPFNHEVLNNISEYLLDDTHSQGHNYGKSFAQNQRTDFHDESYETAFVNSYRPMPASNYLNLLT